MGTMRVAIDGDMYEVYDDTAERLISDLKTASAGAGGWVAIQSVSGAEVEVRVTPTTRISIETRRGGMS